MEVVLIWVLVASILSQSVSGMKLTVCRSCTVSIPEPGKNGQIRVISGMMCTDNEIPTAVTLRKFVIRDGDIRTSKSAEEHQGQDTSAVADDLALLKLLQEAVGKAPVKLEFTFFAASNTHVEAYNVTKVESSNDEGTIFIDMLTKGRHVVLVLSVSQV